MHWPRHHGGGHGARHEDHDSLQERAPRPIWLPQLAEPVTLHGASGEKFPGRVLERSADELVVAIVVPVRSLTEGRARSLVLEYANPGGRVRLSGRVSLETAAEGALVRIAEPRLIEVRQERAHVRVSVHLPLVIRTAAESEPIHTHTEDLSTGGLLVGTPEALAIGDRVALHLTVEAAEPALAAVAEVVRVDGLGRPGLEFAEMGTYDRWRLIHFTVECQSREGFRKQDS
jgi:PilZ domain